VKTSVEILRLLAVTPFMTLAEVAAEIGKTPRAIEMAASKLVKEGRLKYVGPQKGGHWEVIL
jgi:ATP-dependent DNA helicase RecG